MKKLKLVFENSESIELIDDSENSMESMIEDLSSIFNGNYIHSIATQNGAVVFRPTKLSAIYVTEEVEEREGLIDKDELKEMEKLIEDSKIPAKKPRRKRRTKKQIVEDDALKAKEQVSNEEAIPSINLDGEIREE